jgi:ribonucrease Y
MPTAIVVSVVVGVLTLAVGFLIGQALRNKKESGRAALAQAEADKILAEAQTKEKEALLEAKEEAIRIRTQAENEAKEMRQEALRLEQRVAQRDENLDRNRSRSTGETIRSLSASRSSRKPVRPSRS